MPRYGKKQAKRAFELLLTLCNKKEYTNFKDEKKIGKWRLAYTLAGYSIEEIVSEGGAIRQPLGHEYYTAQQFCEMVHSLQTLLLNNVLAKAPTPKAPSIKDVTRDIALSKEPEKTAAALCESYDIKGLCDKGYIANRIISGLMLGDGKDGKNISFHPYTVHYPLFDLVMGKEHKPTIVFKTKDENAIQEIKDYVRESYPGFYLEYME